MVAIDTSKYISTFKGHLDNITSVPSRPYVAWIKSLGKGTVVMHSTMFCSKKIYCPTL